MFVISTDGKQWLSIKVGGAWHFPLFENRAEASKLLRHSLEKYPEAHVKEVGVINK